MNANAIEFPDRNEENEYNMVNSRSNASTLENSFFATSYFNAARVIVIKFSLCVGCILIDLIT